MKNFRVLSFVMIFQLIILLIVYTINLKMENVLLYIYMDDMIIFCTCNETFSRTNFVLESKFKMKDTSEENEILGVRVTRKKDTILLSQKQYTKKLKKFDYHDFKLVNTSYYANYKLKKNNEKNIYISQL